MSTDTSPVIVPFVVIGLGNVFLGDDGFGPLVIETFRCEYSVAADAVEVVDLGTPGLDLAPYLYGRELVLIVDAVHSDKPAGTLSIFAEDDFESKRAKLRITGHDPGLWDSLAHLRLAGQAPQELIVLGVSPESCSFADQICAKLLDTASAAAATIARLLGERAIECIPRKEGAAPDLWWLRGDQSRNATAA